MKGQIQLLVLVFAEFFFYYLRTRLSDVVHLICSLVCHFFFCAFLKKIVQFTVYKLHHVKPPANKSPGITLLVQKWHFFPVSLCYFWHF